MLNTRKQIYYTLSYCCSGSLIYCNFTCLQGKKKKKSAAQHDANQAKLFPDQYHKSI